MRRTTQTTYGVGINIRKALIALIFVMAIVLSFATIHDFAVTATEPADSVALADDAEGNAVPFQGDTDVTVDNLGFPGNNASKREWTSTVLTNNVQFTTTNISAFMETGGDINIVVIGGTGTFTFKENKEHKVRNPELYAVVNYQIPAFIQRLVANSQISVTIKAYSTLNRHNDGGAGSDNSGYYFITSSSPVKAQAGAAVTNKDNYSLKSNFTGTWNVDKTFTLTTNDKYLALAYLDQVGNFNQAICDVSNIRFEFTVKLAGGTAGATFTDTSSTTIVDNMAPAILGYSNLNPDRSEPNGGNYDSSWLAKWPYTPPATTSSQNIVDQITSIYADAKDVADPQASAATLYSYVDGRTNGIGTKNVGGTSYRYYKQLSATYGDQYSYGSTTNKVLVTDSTYVAPYEGYYDRNKTIKVENASYQYFASGIKSVKIGTETIYLYNVNTGATSGLMPIKLPDDSKVYGCFEVKKNHRAEVQINIYFFDNVNVNIEVADYGGYENANKSVDVRGIDNHDPNGALALETLDGYAGLQVPNFNWDTIKWYNNKDFKIEILPNEELSTIEATESTPYMWFYSVVKADTPTQLISANWTEAQLHGKIPFAVGSASTFEYDFENGIAMPVTSGATQYGVANQNGATVARGNGYYLFTFYTMDMAGRYNASNSISYCVKADYTDPTYTLEKLAGATTLTSEQWAAGKELTIKLTQQSPSISGNTLVFLDANDNEIAIGVRDGRIVKLNNVARSVAEIGASSNHVIVGASHVDGEAGRDISITYTITSGNQAVWTIVFGTVPMSVSATGEASYHTFNHTTSFEMIIGDDNDTDTRVSYVALGNKFKDTEGVWRYEWQYKYGNVYVDGLYIRMDKNAPDAPEFLADDDYSNALVESDVATTGNLVIPDASGRVWFTDGWIFPGDLVFSEDLLNDYGDQIKVYLAIKNLTNASGYTAGAHSVDAFTRNFASVYQNYADYAFDRVTVMGGGSLSEGTTSMDIDLISSNSAGIRLIYMWAVDQAGNVSGLTSYYVFADANTYYLRAYIDNNGFDANTGEVLVGGSLEAYSRGAAAQISYGLDTDYVPYQLVKRISGEADKIIWQTGDPTNPLPIEDGGFGSVNGLDFTVYVDNVDADNFGALNTQNGEIYVHLTYRKLVTMQVTSRKVGYSGTQTVVPLSISDENALADIDYVWYDYITMIRPNGTTSSYTELRADAPKNVGKYQVSLYIDSDRYVALPIEDCDYEILQGRANFVVSRTIGEYGDVQNVGYTINGLVGEDLAAWSPYEFVVGCDLVVPSIGSFLEVEIDGEYTLLEDLFADDNAGLKALSVGSHAVRFVAEQKQALIENSVWGNYVLVFDNSYHIVGQKRITLYVDAASKTYGDPDQDFAFKVLLADLPTGIDASNIISLVLKNAVINSTLTAGSADAIYFNSQNVRLIRREIGEDVGVYDYSNSIAAFVLGDGYTISIDTTEQFVINKREIIVIPKNNQEFTYNPVGRYNVEYTIDADAKYLEFFNHVWALEDTPYETLTSDLNYDYYLYELLTDDFPMTADGGNIQFNIVADPALIKIKVLKANGSDLIITIYRNSPINMIYGDTFNSVVKYRLDDLATEGFAYSASKTVENIGNYYVEWTAVLSSINAGVNSVSISSARLYDTDGETVVDGIVIGGDEKLVEVVVDNYSVVVAPRPYTVRAIAGSTTKVYGENDTEYQFAYEIVVPDDSPFDLESLSALVQGGAFTRGIFDGDGNFVRLGQKYDVASNEDGTFASYHYAAIVGSEFVSNDSNFVFIGENDTLRLAISPAVIDFAQIVPNLFGINKVFDGNANVKYTANQKESMYNLSSQLINVTDVVTIDFDASYVALSVGEDDAAIGIKNIELCNFTLAGAQANCYTLINLPAEKVVIEITIDGGDIEIMNAPIVLYKSYFVLSKEYDGTITIRPNDVKITADCALSGSAFVIGDADMAFNTPDVTSNFSTTLKLIFTEIKEGDIEFDRENSEAGISVSYQADGMVVEIHNHPGYITPKVINIEDIVSLQAKNRNYNGTEYVTISDVQLANGVYGIGDTFEDVKINLVAKAYSKTEYAVTKNVGKHNVQFITAETLVGSNYALGFDANDLNDAFGSTEVIISKAKLEIKVAFDANKQYQGNQIADRKVSVGDYSLSPTSIFKLTEADAINFESAWQYACAIEESAVDNPWAIESTYFVCNGDDLSFFYTIDGADSAFVQFEDGNVTKHNVRVNGLRLICDLGREAETLAVFANYEIVAYDWDEEAGEYKQANRQLLLGSSIADFEMLKTATLNQKVLDIEISGINIRSKTYDGTTDAIATLIEGKVGDFGVYETDMVSMTFTGAFEDKSIGTSKKATVRFDSIINTAAANALGIDYARNYTLDTSMTSFGYAQISAAPIAISFDVGTREYNGNNKISDGNVRFTLTGAYPVETGSYYAKTAFAQYDGKDVAYDSNGAVTDLTAKLFGVSLALNNEDVINYYPVFASSEPIADLVAITEFGCLTKPIDISEAQDGSQYDVYYYPLRTMQVYVMTDAQYNSIVGAPTILYTYNKGRAVYHYVDAAAPIAGFDVTTVAYYENALGRITPREVTINVSKTPGTTAFVKDYDGTDIFYGTSADYDTSKRSVGYVGDDDTKIAFDKDKVDIRFATSNSGDTSVEFKFQEGSLISAIDGDETYRNYTASSRAISLQATIKPIDLQTILNPVTTTYGEKADFSNAVEYKLGGKTVTIVDGNMYMLIADGFDTVFAERYAILVADKIDEGGNTYNDVTALRYNKSDDGFVWAEDGEYILFDSVSSVPTIKTSATSATGVGSYVTTLSGGAAVNYVYRYSYNGTDGNPQLGGSVVTINKAVLTVSASVSGKTDDVDEQTYSYRKYFGDENPKITLTYSGFKAGDSAKDISVYPTAEFKLFENGIWGAQVTKSSPLSATLDGCYGVYVDVSGAEADNYTFVWDEKIAKLAVTISNIVGVYFNSTAVDYNNTSKANAIKISGNLTGVTAQYKYYVGDVEISADQVVNAGKYTVVAFVERFKVIEGTEAVVTERSELSATLTVKPVAFTLGYTGASYDYSGENHKKTIENEIRKSIQVEKEDKTVMSNALRISFYGSDGRSTSSVKDAGSYKITVSFNAPTGTLENDAAKIQANYQSFSYDVYVVVVPAIINVKVLPETLQQIVVYEDGELVLPKIAFTYTLDQRSVDAGLSIDDIVADKFQVQFFYGYNEGIADPGLSSEVLSGGGQYNYVIVYCSDNVSEVSYVEDNEDYIVLDDYDLGVADTNYKIIGDVTGLFKFGVNKFFNAEGDTSVELLDGSFINSSSVAVEYVALDRYNLTTDAEFDYWDSIEQYNKYFASKGFKTEVDSVIIWNVTDNNEPATILGPIQVTMPIFFNPSKLESKEMVVYYVNSQGGLTLLTDYEVIAPEYGGYAIVYTADGLSSVVFMKSQEIPLPFLWREAFAGLTWGVLFGIIGGVVAAISIAVTAIVVTKKKKGKGATQKDGDKTEEKTAEKTSLETDNADIDTGVENAENKETAPTSEETTTTNAESDESVEQEDVSQPQESVEQASSDEEKMPEAEEETSTEEVKPIAKKPPVVGKAETASVAEKPIEDKVPPVLGKKPPMVGKKSAPIDVDASAPTTTSSLDEFSPDGATATSEPVKKPPIVGKKKPPIVGKKDN